ncbi:nucleolar protein 7 [Scleropages formosus]|uniref:nucleolar protein 7 n=1 Tax=Scleropages formosus TaxID=113540 RepID=UPI00087902F2|nr:nucleolar protein 7 [Scleropages formosus]
MAEKRRAGLAGPQGKTKSRKMVEKVRLEETSSEDEAPEEVTFEDSKAAAVQRMKDALETARREKELLKERRRKRQALFQEQKNKRLLPDDVLDEIDSKVSRKSKASPKRGGRGLRSEEEMSPGMEDNEDSGHEKREKKVPKKRTCSVKNLKGGLVMRVCDQPMVDSQQQKARDFIQSCLYGKGTNRTTTNQFFSLENKRSQNKSAAVQFVNKQWGKGKKEKAEKFKKQWMHKQKVVDS